MAELHWTPGRLPRLRAQTLRHLTTIAARPDRRPRPDIDALVGHLRAADLYWVSADMTALAVHAGTQRDTTRRYQCTSLCTQLCR